MSIDYQFKYMPLVGKLSGESMARQTETAINEIAQIVNENTAQAEIINTLAQQANDNSVEALEKANEALETSGRVYINESLPVNLNSYCESQLIYIANIQSTNLPILKTGFLEVKTDDLKTECVQLFISDEKDVYVRSGVITSETVGDITTYSATFTEWVSMSSPTILLQASSGISIPLSSDLNDFTSEGTYYCTATNANSLENSPYTSGEFKLIVMKYATASYGFQALYPSSGSFYMRKISGGVWGDWETLATNKNVTTGTESGTISVGGTNVSVNGWEDKANLASPAFTGTPTAPTQATNNNSTRLATTAFVTNDLKANVPLFANDFVTTLTAEDDLNDITTPGTYIWAGVNIANSPSSTSIQYARMFVFYAHYNSFIYQIIFAHSGRIFKRRLQAGISTWSDWKEFAYAEDVLALSGGTMTGDIRRETTTSTENFIVINNSITKGEWPTSTKYVEAIALHADGTPTIQNRLGIIEYTLGTDSANLALRSYNFNTTDNTYAMLTIGQNSSGFYALTNALFRPNADNTLNLGMAGYRWKQLYAGTTTISTSDERLKGNITAIPDEVLDAWGEVGWYQYQFNDSIAEKGETKARLHTGAIAQRIESVFSAHGLDANRYGLLCYDEWKATPAERDEDGNITTPAQPAGNRYSLRYEEALCMEAAYQRRRADRLEERIARLEALVNN